MITQQMMRKKSFVSLCLLLLFWGLTSMAHAAVITGIVYESTGDPLAGVTIKVKGRTVGTNTSGDGTFKIEAESKDVLIVSMIGFKTEEILVGKQKELTVTLKESSVTLNEVVAVGYGTESRRTITSSITKIKGDVLQGIPITTMSDGLKGKIAGVRVTTTNSQPGAEAEIRIRGGSSINNDNDPLILVDGVERSMEGLNPNDIESLEILKDAASTAIYGSRASNGVILITTKKGSKDAPQVVFEGTVATQDAGRKYNFLNAREYLSVLRPAIANSKTTSYLTAVGSAGTGNDENSLYSVRILADGESVPAGWQSMADPVDETQTLIFQDNSFQNEVYRQALWQNYYMGVSGGSGNAKYAASLGYTDDEGVAIGTGFSRLNFNLNTSMAATKRMDLNMGVSYSEMLLDEYDNQRNVISRGLACPPTQRMYDDDGLPMRGYNNTSPSPLFYDYYNDQDKKLTTTSLTSTLKYKILKGLTGNVQGSLYRRNYNSDSFEKANYYTSARTASFAYNQLERNKIEPYLSYRRTFRKHSISAVGGYSYMDQKSKRYSASAEGGNSDKITTLNGAPTKTAASSVIEKQALIGFYSRATYDYQKKYLLTLTCRADGSSLFASGHRWGYFPGMSLGWIASEEKWLKDKVEVLSLLKLKTSYGQTGNNSIGLYDALGKYSVDYKYNGNGGIITSTMPNTNLTWETTNQLDLGIDAGVFNDRITLSADYFDKRTQNLLFDKELPNTTGYSSVKTNVGEVQFYGFDLELNTKNIQNKNFSWSTNVVWSFVKNKVLSLPDNGRDKNRIGGYTISVYGNDADGNIVKTGTEEFGGIAEGESLYSFYGYKCAGILKDEDAADNALYDESASGWRKSDGKTIKGRKDVGDYEWTDRNGDEKITSEDMFKLGSTEPTSTGSMTNSFKYKNFGLNVTMDWALGHSVYEESYSRYFLATFACNYALVDGVNDTYSETNPNAKYARFVANDPNYSANFSRISDVFTYKADYLCVREVSLQYTLMNSTLLKYGVKGVTLTLSGNNLYFFTALPGALSPEKGTSSTYSTSYYCYPSIRKLAMGAKINF
jgi:TonB-linked SusC/RagA family outer membrane protein